MPDARALSAIYERSCTFTSIRTVSLGAPHLLIACISVGWPSVPTVRVARLSLVASPLQIVGDQMSCCPFQQGGFSLIF
jgi:hypothetical protein